jgi:hypothetical protein
VEENAEPARAVEARALSRDGFDQERMLGDREDVRALGLPVPAGDARKSMGDVRDLDVERRGVERCQARNAAEDTTVRARAGIAFSGPPAPPTVRAGGNSPRDH